MSDILQLILSGVSQGIIYALLAIAYNITFASSRTINFSVGSIAMVGAVVGFSLYIDKATGVPFGRSYFIPVMGVMLVGILMGGFVLKAAIEPSLKVRSEFASVLATLAFAGILRNAVERGWGTDDMKFESPLGNEALRFFGAGIYPQELLYIVVAILIVMGLELFKKKTLLGLAVQAVSEDRETAGLIGIPQKFIIFFSFVLSSAIAALAGLLVAPITMVSPTMGTVIGIKAYAVSIIGGLQSGYGTLAGGMILGLSEAVTARYISTGYKDVTGFIILILIVLFRPNGLFGSTKVRKA